MQDYQLCIMHVTVHNYNNYYWLQYIYKWPCYTLMWVVIYYFSTGHRPLFICDSGECVGDRFRCDGSNNCGDNSDEDGCGMMMYDDAGIYMYI